MRSFLIRVRGERAQEGFTLIELLVSMTIFSLVLAGVYGVLITIQKQTADVIARSDSVGNARLALEQIDRQVRSGNVLYSPAAETIPGATGTDQCAASGTNAGTCMRVFTQANAAQKCVQWQVLPAPDEVLRTRSWSPTWTTDGQVSAWSIVARDVINTPSSPPFALTGGQYGSRLVSLTLQVKSPQAGGKPIDVDSALSGRNTAYGYDPGICSPIPPG